MPLIKASQRPFDRNLHHVVGIVRIAREIARKAPQPRQQLDDLRLDVFGRFSRTHEVDV